MKKGDSRSMFHGATAIIFDRARELRANTTEPEKILWDRISNRQLDGFKFRRQHPINTYIADFYCHQAKLVVELDGLIHYYPENKEYDKSRNLEMEGLGIRVIRFRNEEIFDSLDLVIKTIRKELSPLTPFHP